jgi:hypothetical protein
VSSTCRSRDARAFDRALEERDPPSSRACGEAVQSARRVGGPAVESECTPPPSRAPRAGRARSRSSSLPWIEWSCGRAPEAEGATRVPLPAGRRGADLSVCA